MGKNFLLTALLVCAVVFLALFFLLPTGTVFFKAQEFFGTADADDFFALQKLFSNALWQAIASTIFAFAIGFPAAYLFAKREFFGKKFLYAATLVPFVMPSILVALVFVMVLGYNGIVNRGLMGLFGLNEPPLRLLYGFWGIVFAHAFYNFAIFARMISTAWGKVSEKTHQAAQSLGADKTQVFFRVTLPQLVPSILAATGIVFVYCFMSFAVVLTLGGPEFANIETGIFYAATQNIDFAKVAFLSLVQFWFLFAVFVLLNKWSSGFFGEQEFLAKTKPIGKSLAATAYVLFLWMVVAAPFAVLLFFSVFSQNGFSLKAFEQIFFSANKSLAGTTPLTSIVNSLLFAVISSAIATLMALFLAIAFDKKSSFGKSFAVTLAVSVIAVSPITLGLGYFIVFGSGNWLAIVFAHAVIAFPFAFKMIEGQLKKVPKETIEAGKTLGANTWQIIRKVQLPQIKNAIFGAFGFCFAVSLSELGLVMLLSNGKFSTMTVYIQRFISTYNLQAAAAMGLVLMVFSLLCFYGIEKAGKANTVTQ